MECEIVDLEAAETVIVVDRDSLQDLFSRASLIISDNPDTYYLELDGLRYIFKNGEYVGFYNPDGPEVIR